MAVVQTAKGALGTGVIANTAGAVMTANHVIADGSAITIIFADGTKSAATVASADPTTDIAMLTPATLPQPVVAATIGGSAAVGSAVVAIGNPLGLTYSVSSGVVSGLNRTATTDSGKFSGLIQFDASVNPGSSGGPLHRRQGQRHRHRDLDRRPGRRSTRSPASRSPSRSARRWAAAAAPAPGKRTADMTIDMTSRPLTSEDAR